MDVRLVSPDESYKEKLLDFKDEFIKNHEGMHGSAGLKDFETFEGWYAALRDNSREETVRDGLVPATTFIAVNEADKIVGMIDIRHRLNDFLLGFGGHIGYCVRLSERRKGYATAMLSMALEECRKLEIDKCLIVCHKSNIASAKTIIKNGGVLENEVIYNGVTLQRYWITP